MSYIDELIGNLPEFAKDSPIIAQSVLPKACAEVDRLRAELSAVTAQLEDARDNHGEDAATLRSRLASCEGDLVRAGAWAASLKMHHWKLQQAVRDFVRGVLPATWKSKEPRVVGFGIEFEHMKAVEKEPDPAPAARESGGGK